MSHSSERNIVCLFFNERPKKPWTDEVRAELNELFQVIALMAKAQDIPVILEATAINQYMVRLELEADRQQSIMQMVFFDIIYESLHLLPFFKLTTKELTNQPNQFKPPQSPELHDTREFPDLYFPEDDL
jgi:hypothetical protein